HKVVATYIPSRNVQESSESTNMLTVAARAPPIPAADANSSYSEQAVDVTLSATVSATGSSVNAGSVTFQVKNGASNVGSAVTDRSEERGAGKGRQKLWPG